MRRFLSIIWGLIQTIFSASQIPTTIVGVVGVAVMVWAIIWTWIKNLDKVQITLLAIAFACFLYVFINLFIL
jgi:hypothetical protein